MVKKLAAPILSEGLTTIFLEQHPISLRDWLRVNPPLSFLKL